MKRKPARREKRDSANKRDSVLEFNIGDKDDENINDLCKYPLSVFGADGRSALGIGMDKAMVIDSPNIVTTFDKGFRVGSVDTKDKHSVVCNQVTGELFQSNESTKGEFVQLDTDGVFVLHVATTSTTQYMLSGTREVYSWGDDRFGQLGRGTLEEQKKMDRTREALDSRESKRSRASMSRSSQRRMEKVTQKVDLRVVPKLAKVRMKQIVAGRFHVLALGNSGVMYSWGRNRHGQLGHGDYLDRCVPTTVDYLNGCRVVSIAAGGEHSGACGDTTSSRLLGDFVKRTNEIRVVFTWGSSLNGRLGHPEVDATRDPDEMNPANWYKRSNPGKKRTVAATEEQLRSCCSVPCIIKALSGEVVCKLSFGEVHSICVVESTQVFIWGGNGYGQLGLGHLYDEASPVKIESLANVSQASAGWRHSAFVTSQGQLYTTGYNGYGELGLGDTNIRIHPVPVPSYVENKVKILGVSCGAMHTMAWSRISSGDVQHRFTEDYRSRQCVLDGGSEAPAMTVTRNADPDGLAYIALAGPPVMNGKYRWKVHIDTFDREEFPIGIGLAAVSDMDPFMFDAFDQGGSWLYMSNGEKMHCGDTEAYGEAFYYRDVVEVVLDMDVGSLKFLKRGKDLGIAYYVSSSEPLYLCVSLSGDTDQVTLLPLEEEESFQLFDPELEYCFNEGGVDKSSGIEVFYRCRPCNLLLCRACARKCSHRKHCTQLYINRDPTRTLCECEPMLCRAHS